MSVDRRWCNQCQKMTLQALNKNTTNGEPTWCPGCMMDRRFSMSEPTNNEQQAGPYRVVETDVDGVATSWIENDEGRLDDGELAKRLNTQHRQIEELKSALEKIFTSDLSIAIADVSFAMDGSRRMRVLKVLDTANEVTKDIFIGAEADHANE